MLFPKDVAGDYDSILRYFDYSLSADIFNRILRIAGIGLQSDILEVGIGTGKFSAELQKMGYRPYGIDSSASMLDICNSHYPGIPTEIADISNYKPCQSFSVVVSHAGPLRLNHLAGLNLNDADSRRFQEDFGDLFFETYLPSRTEIESVLRNISMSLNEGGLFVMYVQSFPGRERKTRSTPDEFCFDSGKKYEKKTEYIGGKLHKTRTVLKDEQIVWSVPHILTPLRMRDFLAIANRYGLEKVGLDPSNQFYVMRKKSD